MKGNEAIAEAAIRAGCRHYFGYPITPQTEIAAYMAKKMPKIGGVFLQAESEIASINMVSYIIVLYTLSPTGVFSFMVAVASFLAGQYVPIPMLPKPVADVLNFFPFRYVSDLPFRIYIGNINGADALVQIAIQLVWLVAIVLISRFIMSKKINKLVVQGG